MKIKNFVIVCAGAIVSIMAMWTCAGQNTRDTLKEQTLAATQNVAVSGLSSIASMTDTTCPPQTTPAECEKRKTDLDSALDEIFGTGILFYSLSEKTRCDIYSGPANEENRRHICKEPCDLLRQIYCYKTEPGDATICRSNTDWTTKCQAHCEELLQDAVDVDCASPQPV